MGGRDSHHIQGRPPSAARRVGAGAMQLATIAKIVRSAYAAG